jgi:predicted nucleotide-binding protein (sugar kinase/HSP70/actin superfamily)
VLSRGGRRRLEQGKSLAQSDFCAPMLLAHGALSDLVARGVDALFVPSLVNDLDACCLPPSPFRTKKTDSYFCYYSQYAPTILGHLPTLSLDDRLIAPLLSLRSDPPDRIASTIHHALVQKFPELELGDVTRHFEAAWSSMLVRRATLRSRRPALGGDRLQVVLCGRPYVVFERAFHLGIPELLEQLGVTLFWQDELDATPPGSGAGGSLRERMHWSYGQKILDAAELAARTPTLFLVYLSCFRCSPDAFLVSYVRHILDAQDKPFLVLQLDEHSSDVGYTTRIEAALRTFESYRRTRPAPLSALRPERPPADSRPVPGDTVFIPYINRLMSSLWAECFRREGYPAEKLQSSEKIIHTGYRYAHGGECMPAVAIAGGIVHQFEERDLDPRKTFLYLPTVCMACNFPQFPRMVGMAVQAAGIHGMKIPPMSVLSPSETLPGLLGARLFETSIVASLVYKLHHRTKPYERHPGASWQAFLQAEALLVESLHEREGLRRAFARVVELFRAVEVEQGNRCKPRVAILGDLYVKYNEVVNQNVGELIERWGAEIVIPSTTDMTCHFLDVDIRAGLERPNALRLVQSFERRYERMAADLLGEDAEPDWTECVALLTKQGIPPEIAGETSVNVGRALHMLVHRRVDAIVHLNPMFCCPGVVSSALFRKLQAEFSVPIIDIFYDGSGDPNRVLVPHLAYLAERARGRA